MSVKCDSIRLAIAFAAMLLLASCGGGRKTSFPTPFSEEEEVNDTLPSAKEAEEEELEEMGLEANESSLVDSVFNDFLFAYLHSRSLRHDRTERPLRLEHSSRPTEMLEQFDPEFEFGFLSGEYFTTLYGNTAQMRAEDNNEEENDSVVSVQRINLNDGTIRNFLFQRENPPFARQRFRTTTFATSSTSTLASAATASSNGNPSPTLCASPCKTPTTRTRASTAPFMPTNGRPSVRKCPEASSRTSTRLSTTGRTESFCAKAECPTACRRYSPSPANERRGD